MRRAAHDSLRIARGELSSCRLPCLAGAKQDEDRMRYATLSRSPALCPYVTVSPVALGCTLCTASLIRTLSQILGLWLCAHDTDGHTDSPGCCSRTLVPSLGPPFTCSGGAAATCAPTPKARRIAHVQTPSAARRTPAAGRSSGQRRRRGPPPRPPPRGVWRAESWTGRTARRPPRRAAARESPERGRIGRWWTRSAAWRAVSRSPVAPRHSRRRIRPPSWTLL